MKLKYFIQAAIWFPAGAVLWALAGASLTYACDHDVSGMQVVMLTYAFIFGGLACALKGIGK